MNFCFIARYNLSLQTAKWARNAENFSTVVTSSITTARLSAAIGYSKRQLTPTTAIPTRAGLRFISVLWFCGHPKKIREPEGRRRRLFFAIGSINVASTSVSRVSSNTIRRGFAESVRRRKGFTTPIRDALATGDARQADGHY